METLSKVFETQWWMWISPFFWSYLVIKTTKSKASIDFDYLLTRIRLEASRPDDERVRKTFLTLICDFLVKTRATINAPLPDIWSIPTVPLITLMLLCASGFFLFMSILLCFIAGGMLTLIFHGVCSWTISFFLGVRYTELESFFFFAFINGLIPWSHLFAVEYERLILERKALAGVIEETHKYYIDLFPDGTKKQMDREQFEMLIKSVQDRLDENSSAEGK